MEGKKAGDEDGRAAGQVAGVGGKGGGGTWHFVSHDPVAISEGEDLRGRLGLGMGVRTGVGGLQEGDGAPRLIHFKFEPMVSFADGASSIPYALREPTWSQRLWFSISPAWHVLELLLLANRFSDSPRPDGLP